ncbi:SWF/SNF helicase family protein, partial [Candidatus Bipolaricaulota bacterium]|nr:SWF/SNF helicase family protein [Candidatus Bipolaricaulota bacterium]
EEGQREDLAGLLRARIINEWLAMPGQASWLTGGPAAAAERTMQAQLRACEIWAEYLECHRAPEDESFEQASSTPFAGFEGQSVEEVEKLAQLDRLADGFDPETLRTLIATEREQAVNRFSLFSRLMTGDSKWSARRVLQVQFNRPRAFPRVLIAQSRVGREGLNLHVACRRVILFHTEWNPALIEQEIGRVDRIGSLWEVLAGNWRDAGSIGDMPKIEVTHIVFEGTYDEYQSDVFQARRRKLHAHLFGELLDERAIDQMPSETRLRLVDAVPDFSPPPVPPETNYGYVDGSCPGRAAAGRALGPDADLGAH